MKRFDYVRAGNLEEAFAATREGAVVLAGGTNLLDLMKGNVLSPGKIVDITKLTGMDGLEELPDGGVRIGALMRNGTLSRNPTIASRYPLIAEAVLSGASAQLRNAATLGGNLLQRTRCAYFADRQSACNKRVPRSGCDAHGGETRHHAILGSSDECIAVNPSDLCVALVALDAQVEIGSEYGMRRIPLSAFYLLPGSTPWRETVLEPGELITAVILPPDASRFAGNARYIKVRDRTSYAFAVVSAAAALQIEGGVITAARMALGGVAMKPWRVQAAEAVLIGERPGSDVIRRASEKALEDARPSGDNEFKIELSRRTLARTISLACGGTPIGTPALPGSTFSSAMQGGGYA